MEDIDEVLEAAKHLRLQEPLHSFILNPISSLNSPKQHLKASLKERIRHLAGAYISLASFVEDEEVFATLDDSKRSKRVYRRVLKNMEKNDKEIRAFLRGLAANTDALDP